MLWGTRGLVIGGFGPERGLVLWSWSGAESPAQACHVTTWVFEWTIRTCFHLAPNICNLSLPLNLSSGPIADIRYIRWFRGRGDRKELAILSAHDNVKSSSFVRHSSITHSIDATDAIRIDLGFLLISLGNRSEI